MAFRLLPLFIAVAATALPSCADEGTAGPAHREPGANSTHADRAQVLGASAVGRTSSGARPWMPDAPRRRAVLWAVGDGAGAPDARVVTAFLATRRVDRLLYLGDVYDTGTAEEFRTGYHPTYGRFARRTAPTPGNHEWGNRRTGYNAYWRRVRGRTPPQWYSFGAGGWRVLVLNSETGGRAEQLRWLRAHLRARGTCRVAVIHRPRYSAALHGDEHEVDAYWRALQGHARLVVSGHDHTMQRFRARGSLIQLVSGAGGNSHYRLNRRRNGLAFGDDRRYGAARLDLRPGIARIAFVATNGRVLDATTVRCRS